MLGCFAFVEPDALRELEQEIRARGRDGLFYHGSRLHRADAEDLAEGGVRSVLIEVEPFPNRQGVNLDSVTSSFGEDHDSIAMNDHRYSIRGEEDVRREKTQPGWIWEPAAVRTVDLLNRELLDAGSDERAHAVSGRNDRSVFVLTEPLHGLIAGHPDALSADTPYDPTEEYPWFGQPQ